MAPPGGYEAVGEVDPDKACCGCCSVPQGGVITVLIVLASIVGAHFALVSALTPMAIKGMITLEKNVNHFCDKEANLDMSNITTNIFWPGCTKGGASIKKMEDFDKCLDKDNGGCIDTALMKAMDSFNKKYGGKLVSYKSREGKGDDGKDLEVVELRGWLLEAPNAKPTTPRIVVQHGFTSNGNKFGEEFVAYQLRKLGFTVLVNNFRDHCYSGASKAHTVEWGHAYPYDLLGAVDYLRKDPDDNMGGSLGVEKVGIVGFSMGAFTTNNAFGLDHDLPAVWVDAPPKSAKSAFLFGSQRTLGGMGVPSFLIPVFGMSVNAAWTNVEAEAKKRGVDLNENLPETVLPKGPDTKRQIFVSYNGKDGVVPPADPSRLAKMLKKYPKKYDVTVWQHHGKCVMDKPPDKPSPSTTHCIDHLQDPAAYEAKLCKFWTSVFDLADKTCGGQVSSPEGDEGGKKDDKADKDGKKTKDKTNSKKSKDAKEEKDTKDDEDKAKEEKKRRLVAEQSGKAEFTI